MLLGPACFLADIPSAGSSWLELFSASKQGIVLQYITNYKLNTTNILKLVAQVTYLSFHLRTLHPCAQLPQIARLLSATPQCHSKPAIRSRAVLTARTGMLATLVQQTQCLHQQVFNG